MSRRRQYPDEHGGVRGLPGRADTWAMGRPYIALAVYCRAHPTRRLAWFARLVEDHPPDPGRVLYVIGDRETPRAAGDGATKVPVVCRDCGTDLQWRTDRIAGWLGELADRHAHGVTRIYV